MWQQNGQWGVFFINGLFFCEVIFFKNKGFITEFKDPLSIFYWN
jgi:hypothetical protein